jgi:hypothetical protein
VTFGLSTVGDYGQILFSTDTYSQIYLGKATYVSTQGYANYGAYYAFINGTTLYNWPVAAVIRYTFDSGGRDVIFYTYTPYPAKSAVVSANKSGNVYTVFVAVQPAGPLSVIPTLYCFGRANSASTSGYGMNLYREDGTIAMSSQDKQLINKYIYFTNTPASNLVAVRAAGFDYVGNSGNQNVITQQIVSPISGPTQAVSKPIVFCASSQLATGRNPNVSSVWLYELCASFNSSTKNIHLEWISVSFTFGSFVSSVPQRTGLIMVADGADYD